MGYETASAGKIKSDDIVIALMGPTGSGKSQIIDTLTGQNLRAGGSLKPATDEVFAYRILHHKKYGSRLVLLDTPGFDDLYKTDRQILEMISRWMMNSPKLMVTGILYVHRITDRRMSNSLHKQLHMFEKICGDNPANNVMFLSTMWDKANVEDAENREAALKKSYWNVMIEHGATSGRFYKNEHSGPRSPWTVIDTVIHRHRRGQALLLQKEMVEFEGRLNKTEVGKSLVRKFLGLKGRTDVDDEMATLRAEMRKLLGEPEETHIPLWKKIGSFFARKE